MTSPKKIDTTSFFIRTNRYLLNKCWYILLYPLWKNILKIYKIGLTITIWPIKKPSFEGLGEKYYFIIVTYHTKQYNYRSYIQLPQHNDERQSNSHNLHTWIYSFRRLNQCRLIHQSLSELPPFHFVVVG